MKNYMLVFSIIFGSASFAQNVGIGTNTPGYKLDVAGRLRLQNTAQTAGIWFDGNVSPTRSFIGTYNNDLVGIYGAGGGWNMVMNVNTGHVGIGTLNPNADLDVLGSMRYRGNSFPNLPKPGASLQALDEQGNME